MQNSDPKPLNYSAVSLLKFVVDEPDRCLLEPINAGVSVLCPEILG